MYGAQQNVLQQIANLQSGALGSEQNLHQGVVSSLQNAFQNFIANPSMYAGQFSGNAPAAVRPPRPVPVPAHHAVTHALVNPYTTGQKLYG